MSSPAAGAAATGAITSRPSKVQPTRLARKYVSLRIETMASSPKRASTMLTSPLSGATTICPAYWAASSRRSVPTPGSTTARWTVPAGK